MPLMHVILKKKQVIKLLSVFNWIIEE